MSDGTRIRPILDDDWDAVAELESRAYAGTGLSEDRTVLESRGRAAPATCFVLDTGTRITGYVLAMPYPLFRYPDLARDEQTAFSSPNLHLHDLVIAAEQRGKGLAGRLLRHLTTTARTRTHDRLSLVAVAGSVTFWTANEFRPHLAVTVNATYGADAVYMSKAI